MAVRHGAAGSARTINAAAAMVSRLNADDELHLSLPRVPLRDRKARRRIRQWVNTYAAAAPQTPLVIHRITRSGAPTNKMGWLAWL